MITADQLVAHAAGDYVFQSDWMANQKVGRSLPAAAHALAYTAAFLPITRRWKPLAAIAATHFVIDRWRLARYVVWAKEHLAPADEWPTEHTPTGYDSSKSDWLAVWLMIAADNTMHVICNGAALRWL